MEEGRVKSAHEKAEPRWGCLATCLTAGFCPAKTARRTDYLPWKDAILTHLLALLMVGGSLLFLVPWNDTSGADLLREIEEAPLQCLATVLSVDLGYLLLSLFLAPWGAGRERVRTSLGRSLHRTLRHTPHVAQAFALAGLLASPFFMANHRYWETFRDEVDLARDHMAANGIDSETSEAWSRAYEIVNSHQPFYALHGEEIGSVMYFAGGLWLLWGLLSAIRAAPLKEEADERPPTCETCGYNLTGLQMEGRCPECGTPVVESLGPDARPGTPWQRRATRGRWAAFRETAVGALLHPRRLGAQLVPSQDAGAHRTLLLLQLPVVAACAWAGSIACYVADTGRIPWEWDAEFLWLFCPFASYFTAIAAVFVALGAAGWVGFLMSWKYKRNLLPSAMHAACCASGFISAWVVADFAAGAILIAYRRDLREMVDPFGLGEVFVIVFFLLGPNVVCGLAYLWLIARIVRGTRFSNK